MPSPTTAVDPKLDLNWEKNPYITARGQVIVFGGDEVYPTASRVGLQGTDIPSV